MFDTEAEQRNREPLVSEYDSGTEQHLCGGIYSWWYMLRNYCSEIAGLYNVLMTMKTIDPLHSNGYNQRDIITGLTVRRRTLERLNPLLTHLQMNVSVNLCNKANRDLDVAWITEKDALNDKYAAWLVIVNQDLISLSDTIIAELESRSFYYVTSQMVPFYEINQFDKSVVDEFPDAIDDMEEAGKCYALGRHTASVFHLIRVAEHGLNKISGDYGFHRVESWGQFLTNLREYALKNKTREKEIMVLHAKIGAMKAAWRDDTMHVVRHYSAEQSEEIWQAIRHFMTEITGSLP